MRISPPALSEAWHASLAFHGHACPGLALGCRVAVEALVLCGFPGPSVDEELVCVAETDSCAVDAIQAVTGCTLGKGNLILRMRGKHAFSFFARGRDMAVRFLWTDTNKDIARDLRIERYLTAPANEVYITALPGYALPEKALLSPSLVCARCGEKTSEPHVRLHEGQYLCLDCHAPCSRIIL